MNTVAKFVEFRNTILDILETQYPELKGRGSDQAVAYIKHRLDELDRSNVCVAVTDQVLDTAIELLKNKGIVDVLAGFELRGGVSHITVADDGPFSDLKGSDQTGTIQEIITLTRHLISILLAYISPEEANA